MAGMLAPPFECFGANYKPSNKYAALHWHACRYTRYKDSESHARRIYYHEHRCKRIFKQLPDKKMRKALLAGYDDE